MKSNRIFSSSFRLICRIIPIFIFV